MEKLFFTRFIAKLIVADFFGPISQLHL